MTSNVFDVSSNPGGCTQIIQLVNKTSDSSQKGFDLTDNKGGEYKVEISKNSDFANQLKSDNFKIDEQQCSQCGVVDPAIDIIKTTQGGDDTFAFTLQEKSPPKSQSFTISTQSGSGSYSFPDIPEGTYTITEDLTGMDGWESQGVQCTIQNSSNLTVTSPTNSITIELLFGDKATCEFKNIKLPTLIVAKKTIGGYGDFDFTVTNGTDSSQDRKSTRLNSSH